MKSSLDVRINVVLGENYDRSAPRSIWTFVKAVFTFVLIRYAKKWWVLTEIRRNRLSFY